ncbi:hypothetical protein [Polynucleobacter difficilis]|uniref:hypothetical protein n=1 Tax=Polynucleobacter difficilis TaxID=556054 RepID=UPI000D362618|nr:hypothetical protein [Polynucleobacter difficilis]
MEDDLVYKRPRKRYPVETAPALDAAGSNGDVDFNPALPTLAQLQEKQRSELIEMAQVRYGIKGSQIQVNLTPLQLDLSMSQGQIFKALLAAPESERADQVLYALAKGELDVDMANQILASLALLSKFKKIKIES